jgi:hypothetical protein
MAARFGILPALAAKAGSPGMGNPSRPLKSEKGTGNPSRPNVEAENGCHMLMRTNGVI